ncbi:MAG TPA: hypothetical protein PKD41_02175 [Solidesulfovibrio sp.]|nr:hypothetical protein [Solidesulfovibrio sp.]
MSDTKEKSGLLFATMSDPELIALKNCGGLCDSELAALNKEILLRHKTKDGNIAPTTHAEAIASRAKIENERLVKMLFRFIRYVLVTLALIISSMFLLWAVGVRDISVYKRVAIFIVIADTIRRQYRKACS